MDNAGEKHIYVKTHFLRHDIVRMIKMSSFAVTAKRLVWKKLCNIRKLF